MAISRVDFWYFITELVLRNPNLGIPALEDGLFANLLICNYLYIYIRRKAFQIRCVGVVAGGSVGAYVCGLS